MAMRDLTSAASMKLKAVLFLVIGVFSGILLVFGPDYAAWQTALLLVMCVWAFCRAYYFAFYVIEKYVDASFRFSGLGSAVKYLLGKKQAGAEPATPFTDPPAVVSSTGLPCLPLKWWLLWLFIVVLGGVIPWFHLRENVRELIEPLRYPWGLLPVVFLGFSWFGELSLYVFAASIAAGGIAWRKPSWGRAAIMSALVLQLLFTSAQLLYSSRLVVAAIKDEVSRRQPGEKSHETARPAPK